MSPVKRSPFILLSVPASRISGASIWPSREDARAPRCSAWVAFSTLASDSNFLPMQPWEAAATSQIVGFLLATRVPCVEFLAPLFSCGPAPAVTGFWGILQCMGALSQINKFKMRLCSCWAFTLCLVMHFHLNKRSCIVGSVLTWNSVTIQMQLFPCGAGGRWPPTLKLWLPLQRFTALSALSVAVWDRLLLWMGLSWGKTDILAPGLGMVGPLPHLFFIFTLFIRNGEVVMGKIFCVWFA